MKTRKWGKTILALLLAMLMILPSLVAIAEDDPEPTELGDLEFIQVWAEEWDDENYANYWKMGTDGESGWGEAPSGVIIAGEVKTDGGNAVSVYGYGGTVDLTVGKVTAEKEQQAQGEMPPAVDIQIYNEKSDITFTSDDVVSDGDGIDIQNGSGYEYERRPGGTVTVNTGNIEAKDTGVFVENANGTTTVTTGGITAGEYGVQIDTTALDGDEYQGNYLSGVNDQANNENEEDEKSSEAVTKVTVNGDIVATGNTGAYGIYAEADTYNSGSDSPSSITTIIVDGKVTAEASATTEYDKNEVAVYADAKGEGAETNISIGEGAEGRVDIEAYDGGSVNLTILDGGVTVSDDWTAVYAENGNSTVDINVTGDVTATDTYSGIEVDARGEESKTTIVINGDISVNNGEEKDQSGQAVGLYVKDGANITATITGENIEVIGSKKEDSEEEWNTETIAIDLGNCGGDINVTVKAEEITATGADENTGIFVESLSNGYEFTVLEGTEPEEIDESQIFDTEILTVDGKEVEVYIVSAGEGEEALPYIKTDDGKYLFVDQVPVYEKGATNLTVTGNVTGDQEGVTLNVAEVQTANITIDGTVTGEEAGIVLMGETELSEDLTMTVWEVVPNKDKAVAVRKEYDEEGKAVYTEDEEAEKLIQYIIKIKDDSKPFIAASGTTDFTAGNGEKYQVANEGDKVLVKLTIPEGKELVGAYWNQAQSEAGKLLVDPATGDYYVEVPRGGGVELSLVMKDIPTPEPQPEPQPQPEPEKKYSVATPILTVTAVDNDKVEIRFYKSGNFVVTMEDGSKEKGTYAFENGQLVLNCESGKVEVNADEEFTYTSAQKSLSHQFKLSQAEIDVLKGN